ncbi:lysophospholipase L1-like esterase [Catenulispora sp. EB89]|uniref:GDSL-type esterase/lipase family protein n=1 Tax=Catenulispora sp. EB89 TaxID=3156257 RepID=UPI0035186B99
MKAIPARHRATALAVCALAGASFLPAASAASSTSPTASAAAATTFTGTWATSQPSTVANNPAWQNQTLRMVARTSLGGDQIRVDLSDAGMAGAATFGHVTVGVQQNGGTTTATPVTVTFNGGSRSVTVPAGGKVASDPVAMPVTPGTRLLVSIYVPSSAPISTAPSNTYALQTEYNANGVDASGDQFFPTTNTFGFTTFLAGVDVDSAAKSTVVAIGDSITAAMGTPGNSDTAWTDYLAARTGQVGLGMVNVGETGDQVIADQPGNPSVTTRWTRDVLDIPGARTVIEEGGINDLRAGVTAAQLEAAQIKLAASAHNAGLKFLLTTLTPCGGVGGTGTESCNSAFETQRLAYNSWVRGGAGGIADGYSDFDAALGGYSNNGVGILNSTYDSGDHIHPNIQGNAVMADLVPVGKL